MALFVCPGTWLCRQTDRRPTAPYINLANIDFISQSVTSDFSSSKQIINYLAQDHLANRVLQVLGHCHTIQGFHRRYLGT